MGARYLALLAVVGALCGGCTSSSAVVAVDRRPSAALLLPCVDPVLVPDPEAATSEQINVERIAVARAYVDCRQRHGDLVTFVKGGRP